MSVGDRVESIEKNRRNGVILDISNEQMEESETWVNFYTIQLDCGSVVCEPYFFWLDEIPF